MLWLAGTDRLSPHQPLTCGVTLCVGAYAARLRGYTLSVEDLGTVAFKDDTEALPLETVARRELGLTIVDAAYLFDWRCHVDGCVGVWRCGGA
ncbi:MULTISPECIES: hypothetical protein [unclassified Streptomyces]|uniref:hypothetical protein n=1 Tax=unclassified Streptomyces TaxID=2593676 RepID=UPI003D911E86